MASRPSVTRSNLPTPYRAVQPPSYRLASIRLRQFHGEAVSTWQDRISGERSWFLGLGRIIRALRDVGLSDRIPELMIPIDAAMAPCHTLTLTDAIHASNSTDALEDVAQADFIRTTGEGELEAWIKRVAHALDRDSTLLVCLEAERQRRKEERA